MGMKKKGIHIDTMVLVIIFVIVLLLSIFISGKAGEWSRQIIDTILWF